MIDNLLLKNIIYFKCGRKDSDFSVRLQILRGLLTYYNPIIGTNGILCLQKRAKTHASARSACCSL